MIVLSVNTILPAFVGLFSEQTAMRLEESVEKLAVRARIVLASSAFWTDAFEWYKQEHLKYQWASQDPSIDLKED